MTEAEWLACDRPMEMYAHLERWAWPAYGASRFDKVRSWVRDRVARNPFGPRPVVERKLYLLACGVNRDWRAKREGDVVFPSVELEERFADRDVTLEVLLADDSKRFWWWRDAWHLVSNVFRRSIGKPDLDAHWAVYCDLTRCVFGNPFRPVELDRRWLTSTVVALSRSVYADRAFDRLPILADALQDAGCDSDSVLSHCRGDGPHTRGCWVVDLLLGKV